jgi:hypothetical protein
MEVEVAASRTVDRVQVLVEFEDSRLMAGRKGSEMFARVERMGLELRRSMGSQIA